MLIFLKLSLLLVLVFCYALLCSVSWISCGSSYSVVLYMSCKIVQVCFTVLSVVSCAIVVVVLLIIMLFFYVLCHCLRFQCLCVLCHECQSYGSVYSVLYVLWKCLICIYSRWCPVWLLSCVDNYVVFLCLVSLFHVLNVYVSCVINFFWQCL